jgi:acetylornithine/succinyldiaminopimelate/putrescine aminotransferase
MALTVIRTIEEEGLLHNATEMGNLMIEKMGELVGKYEFIECIRGMGLMLALVFDRPVKPLYSLLLKHGLLALNAGEKAMRFLPPLNITSGDILEAVQRMDAACAEWRDTQDQNR